MTEPPVLTDRPALALRRHRARAMAADGTEFLHRLAANEIEERLEEVNRRFTEVAVVTGHAGFWRERFPAATCVPDDDTLALEPGAHDLVIHALALHWANDPVGQLIQARRALRPDGLFLGATFGGQSLNELRTVLAETEIALTGGLSPRVLPMADVRDLGGLLQRAGLALPVADTVPHTVTYDGFGALISDLRAMGETNALADRERCIPPRALFHAAAERYAGAFPAEGGRIRATVEMIFLTGWAPDDSQPQPLRPGTATARLADALGTVEAPAGDTVPTDKD